MLTDGRGSKIEELTNFIWVFFIMEELILPDFPRLLSKHTRGKEKEEKEEIFPRSGTLRERTKSVTL